MQKIIIRSTSGNILDGSFLAPPEPTGKAVLFVHGWMGDQDSQLLRAKPLTGLGYSCLTFSLSAHGTSTGDIETLTRRDFLNDVMSAYDYLKAQEGIDANKIAVAGASFGGYLAALLTQERPVNSLVLRAPANYPDTGFDNIPQATYTRDSRDIQSWRQKPLAHMENLALQALNQYSGRVLIVESENDTVIPHQTVQNYRNAIHDPSKLDYNIIPDADHNLSDENHLQQFITLLVDWFR